MKTPRSEQSGDYILGLFTRLLKTYPEVYDIFRLYFHLPASRPMLSTKSGVKKQLRIITVDMTPRYEDNLVRKTSYKCQNGNISNMVWRVRNGYIGSDAKTIQYFSSYLTHACSSFVVEFGACGCLRDKAYDIFIASERELKNKVFENKRRRMPRYFSARINFVDDYKQREQVYFDILSKIDNLLLDSNYFVNMKKLKMSFHETFVPSSRDIKPDTKMRYFGYFVPLE